jgi:excisionase family DNA binding protein
MSTAAGHRPTRAVKTTHDGPKASGEASVGAPSSLLDMEGVACWLGTSVRHVQRLVTERRIPYLKVGHFIRFDPGDVALWIEEQKVDRGSRVAFRSGTIDGERQVAPTARLSRRPTSAAEILARWQTGSR